MWLHAGCWRAGGVASIVLAGTVWLGGCGLRTRASQLYPDLLEYSGRRIEDVRFTGAAPFGSDSLLSLIETQPSHCSLLGLPICVPFTRIGRREHRFNLGRVHTDVMRLESFYRYSGYFGTSVKPRVEDDREGVRVTFAIQRADPIVLDALAVRGTDGILNRDSLAERLVLHPGDTFHLGKFGQSADQIQRGLLMRGHAHAQVLRNFTVDTIRNRARASLEAVPGPVVVVDSIAVYGARHLGRNSVLRQLSFRQGDVLMANRLTESQRNLYSLELVQLASVSLAPDSLDATPGDSARATVMVRIAEARVNQADVAVGFGTVECLRADGQYINRSFTGGARRLAIVGSVSKIGLGGATSSGVGRSLCRAFAADTFENSLDYRLSADFTQPFFLSPRNHLTLNAFVERDSEPSVYQRQARGGRILVTRRLAPRALLSGGLDLEYGSTIASAAVFCVAFEVCVPETINHLRQARWRNTLGASVSVDRTNFALDPTSGYYLRLGTGWAPTWLSSDVTYFRGTTEVAVFHETRPNWVLAGSVRLGSFFKTSTLRRATDFLPPEERFYAGGAYTVRGYGQNQLGDGVYVTDSTIVNAAGEIVPEDDARFVPLGGTALSVLNAELRMPSPFLRRRMRFVVFVDAGAVSSGNIWNLTGSDMKVTPGMGVRIQTPVGPARVDVAFNPYPPQLGPLYVSDGEALVRVRDSYRPDTGPFFNRFRIHLAVGQAF